MTSICFKECFGKKNMKLDFSCVQTCYDKYLFSISHISNILKEEGRSCRSDYVKNAVGLRDENRLLKVAYPIGGQPGFMGDQDTSHKNKKYEAYQYSDVHKSGR